MTANAATAWYAAATVVAVALAGGALSLLFAGADARRALFLTGTVATVVQVLAFTLARRTQPANRVAGWAAGAGICLLTMFVFGFVARPIGLPLEPALFGLATYLFITELFEPFFLK